MPSRSTLSPVFQLRQLRFDTLQQPLTSDTDLHQEESKTLPNLIVELLRQHMLKKSALVFVISKTRFVWQYRKYIHSIHKVYTNRGILLPTSNYLWDYYRNVKKLPIFTGNPEGSFMEINSFSFSKCFEGATTSSTLNNLENYQNIIRGITKTININNLKKCNNIISIILSWH